MKKAALSSLTLAPVLPSAVVMAQKMDDMKGMAVWSASLHGG